MQDDWKAMLVTQKPDTYIVDSVMVTHPYSIYIWQPAHTPGGVGSWIEPAQCYTQEYALYIANLIHKDARAVIKVVRYGLNIACFPDEHTVQFVEQQIARQQTRDPVEHRRLVS